MRVLEIPRAVRRSSRSSLRRSAASPWKIVLLPPKVLQVVDNCVIIHSCYLSFVHAQDITLAPPLQVLPSVELL